MPLLVKICGLKTPDALDAALEAGADMVGFVFFPPSPRNLGIEAARALGERVQGRAKKVALSVDATDAELDRVVEALQARHAATARQGDAGARRRGALALRPAGDEGAADRGPTPISRRSGSTRRSPTGCCSTAARRARRRGPAGSASRSTGRLLENLDLDNSVHAVGRARCRTTSPRRLRITRARRRSMCRRASSARPARRTRTRIRAFIRAARAGRQRDAAKLVEHGMTVVQQPNSFRTGPDERGHFGIYGGRFVAETLMPLILELEQAYAAAKADPAFKREMDGHLEELRRPAVAALFRRAADRAFRRRQDLLQARGPQPHRRAQGEQRARPDHAGQAHGQAARHRRDRRRHARRRDRDAVRQVRPEVRGVHGRARRRRASSRTCCACRRSAPRCGRSSPARRR